MKISIITASYNSAATIRDTLQSVSQQTYQNIEHIIVDGASKDATMDIVKEFPHVAKIISEQDKGIYDAMNKGILLATGDYIGLLNSDDFYPDNGVVARIVNRLELSGMDALIGDILFVSPTDLSKKLRYYSSYNWHPGLFSWGFMPPHPSFYVRRDLYNRFGLYDTSYRIAADYELLIRFLYKHRISFTYLREPLVYMRAGGISNQGVKSRWILNKEIVRACTSHGLKTSMPKLMLKYFIKIFEYLPKVKS